MSRHLPLDIARLVQPIPSSFAPTFEQPDHRYLRWSATLDVKGHGQAAVELGFHRRKGDQPTAAEHLRASAWQATELARLGRIDLLKHCLKTRHKRDGIQAKGMSNEHRNGDVS